MPKIQSRAMLASLSYRNFSLKKTDKQVTRQVIKENEAVENSGKFVKQILPASHDWSGFVLRTPKADTKSAKSS